jgi:hypothetical protein
MLTTPAQLGFVGPCHHHTLTRCQIPKRRILRARELPFDTVSRLIFAGFVTPWVTRKPQTAMLCHKISALLRLRYVTLYYVSDRLASSIWADYARSNPHLDSPFHSDSCARLRAAPTHCARAHGGDAVNREAQIATMLTVSFALAFLGWALVPLASAPVHPHKDDVNRTRFRRWLIAATHRLLKAR